ncbi:MAG TPA: hypothetical protein VFV05_07815 [Methylomirabilota bacterium]|nr:hypothetical protein [Methylomirabilota bacterium]
MDSQPPGPPWTPPRWLRNLRLVASEVQPYAAMSPQERLRLVFELMSFAAARLQEQAERRGCTAGELLHLYERAGDRLRARG